MRITRLQRKRGCLFFPLVQVWIRSLSQQIVPRGHGSTGRQPLDNRHVQRSSDALVHKFINSPVVTGTLRGPTGARGRAPLWPGRPSSSSLYNQMFPLWAAESVPLSTLDSLELQDFTGIFWLLKPVCEKIYEPVNVELVVKSTAHAGSPGVLHKDADVVASLKVWEKIHNTYLGRRF